ncbi:MAG: ABC transporter ATP-binding protein [Nitrospirota bacterium]
MPDDSLIAALEGVSRIYDGGRISALNSVTLHVRRNEFLVITGPSGSGKSTLLHLLCGLDRPTQGRVLFEGSEPRSSKEWTKLRAKRIGFVFQSFNLLPTLTALENIEVPMFGQVSLRSDRRGRAMELLSGMGLSDRAGQFPSELSGGERQRVAIARAMANNPDILLADEPTGNLDSRSSAEVMKLLFDIQSKSNSTLVIVTHDRDLAKGAERTINIVDGRISQPEAGEETAACTL